MGKGSLSDMLRSVELKIFINEINYKRIKQGKKKLSAREISKYIIKNNGDRLVNELIKI